MKLACSLWFARQQNTTHLTAPKYFATTRSAELKWISNELTEFAAAAVASMIAAPSWTAHIGGGSDRCRVDLNERRCRRDRTSSCLDCKVPSFALLRHRSGAEDEQDTPVAEQNRTGIAPGPALKTYLMVQSLAPD